MELWQINLLGTPRITRNGQERRPQARETWAVLAALLLPRPLHPNTVSSPPPPQDRHKLAAHFWEDDARLHLRQSLAFLRKTFGEGCFVGGRDTVQAAGGRFVTDVDQMLLAYRQALASTDVEDRLHYFLLAVGQMQGEFLEGCFHPGERGEPWMLQHRRQLQDMMVTILTAYLETLVEAAMLPAALDIACRILTYQPDHPQVREQAQALARKTGRTALYPALQSPENLQAATTRLRSVPLSSIRMEDRRAVSALFEAEIGALAPEHRKAFQHLAVFPAPFSAEVARTVCRVSKRTLLALAKTFLIERRDERFEMLPLVQASAWRQVPTATRRQLHRRLAAVCDAWMYDAIRPPNTLHLPFTTVAQATPFLQTVLEWNLQQTPTVAHVDFIYGLRVLALLDLAGSALPYLRDAWEQETLSITVRVRAARCAGDVSLYLADYPSSIRAFEKALALHSQEPDVAFTGGMHFVLGWANHYGRNSQAALEHLATAEDHFTQVSNTEGIGQCQRFRCEVLHHTGDYAGALIACEKALQIRREIRPRWDSVADAVYWKGMTLWRLARIPEGALCFEEALSIWQETKDTSGIALCLRMLGRICGEAGRFAEARAHIEHAILLHERMKDRSSRIAAVEALADIYFREGRLLEAREYYAECLEDSEAQQVPARIERFRARVQECSHIPPV